MKADIVSNSEYVPPHRREPSTDPAIVSPLKPIKGEKPPAPAWFHWALERAPERTFTSVDGVRIETLIWG